MQELIVIEQPKVREVFVTENGIEPILKLIKSEIDKFPVLDVTVKKDREEIKAQVTKIKKCRAYIEGVGKDLAAEMKKEPKLVDAARKKAWDQLGTWEKQVRQPLSDWEEAEERRKEAALSAIQRIRDLATSATGFGSHMLVNLMTDVNTFNPADFDDDFVAIAKDAKADAIIKLSAMLDERRTYEAEQAELEELRKAKATQEVKDRLELIEKARLEEIRIAEERVRKEAEEKAIAEKARLGKEAEELRLKTENESLALKVAAEKAEREKLEAIEAQRVAAERAEEAKNLAELDALRRIEEAKAAEAKRIEAERLAALAAEKKREANKAHAKKINGEAVKCLMQIEGITNELAMEIVKAIVKGQIDNVSIKY